jgi:hypothetical protein
MTALHWCYLHGHTDACRLLIEARASVDARDIKYQLPLLQMLRWCVYALNSEWTPLHYAANFSQPDAARLLLDSGADIEAIGTECAQLHLPFSAHSSLYLSQSAGVQRCTILRTMDTPLSSHCCWQKMRAFLVLIGMKLQGNCCCSKRGMCNIIDSVAAISALS